MIKIAVSSGDPAGIGPDICIKAFGQKKIYDFSPVIFGDKELFKSRAKTLGINADIQTHVVEFFYNWYQDFLIF